MEAQGPAWSRFLTLDGERAYYLDTSCDTCGFFFERLPGANEANLWTEQASNTLKKGINTLNDPLIEALVDGLPPDDYMVCIFELEPYLVRPGTDSDYFTHEQVEVWGLDPFWGLPHNPKVPYYRVKNTTEGPVDLFEFVVPMIPDSWLKEETVEEYRKLLEDGVSPMGISLTWLELRSPVYLSTDEPRGEHWCLVHYLLDGHHKLYASSQAGKPIRLLGFVPIADSDEDMYKLIEQLRVKRR